MEVAASAQLGEGTLQRSQPPAHHPDLQKQLDAVALICKCQRPVKQGVMIQCGKCLKWGHSRCNNIADDESLWGSWTCQLCPVTPKRKDGRGRKPKVSSSAQASPSGAPEVASQTPEHPLSAPGTPSSTSSTKRGRAPMAFPALNNLGPTRLQYAPGHEPTTSSGRPMRQSRKAPVPTIDHNEDDSDSSDLHTSKRRRRHSKGKDDGNHSSALSSADAPKGYSSDEDSSSSDGDFDANDEDEVASAIAVNHVKLENWLNHASPGLGVSAGPLLLNLGITHHAQFARFRTLEWWNEFFDQEIAGQGLSVDDEQILKKVIGDTMLVPIRR